MKTSLAAHDLRKTFGTADRQVQVLNGVTLEMSGGSNLAVMGPSGSGKSTLLHLLGTLDQPSSGTIRINGINPFELTEPELARFRNRGIGFVFQDHHLLPQYNVLENVLIPSFAYPDPKSNASERATDLLTRVGLQNRMDHRPAELSGGESQRVAIARALINQPSLLLCDEPTGNLDEDSAKSVADLLFQLHREEQNILIVVTHNLDLAARFEERKHLAHGLLQ